ncbi:MAG: macro domain-containing protein [Tissierellia bacterium]|nr:macro domain-containing protein [Tissierellia bacterium]
MKLKLLKGDITELKVDAIVNAANKSLLGGGGVDGAIHAKAGRELYLFNKQLGGCNTSEAKISPAFNLPAKHVISTVGPIWGAPFEEREKELRLCYINSLNLAKAFGIKTIAFPSISTGAYGYPIEKAAKTAITAILSWLKDKENDMELVYMVLFSEDDYNIYKSALEKAQKLEGIE